MGGECVVSLQYSVISSIQMGAGVYEKSGEMMLYSMLRWEYHGVCVGS
jgi:hypothetical protein